MTTIRYSERKAQTIARTLMGERIPGGVRTLTAARDLQVVAQRDRLIRDLLDADPDAVERCGNRLAAATDSRPQHERPHLLAIVAICDYLSDRPESAMRMASMAQAIDPTHGLSRLVLSLLDSGEPPARFVAWMRGVTREEIAATAVPTEVAA